MRWFAVRSPVGYYHEPNESLHLRFRAIYEAILFHGFAVVAEATLRRLRALPGGDLLYAEEMPEGSMGRGVTWLRMHGE